MCTCVHVTVSHRQLKCVREINTIVRETEREKERVIERDSEREREKE